MKPSALRAFLRRYGNTGFLIVGLYLSVHHLWSRHRRATVITVCGMLSAGALIYARLVSAPHSLVPHSRVVSIPHRPDTQAESVHHVAPPVRPHGRPLFSHTTKLLRAEGAWSWGGWDHAEYRWLSDTELFFAEAHTTPGERIARARLYRYNVRTGRKRHLKKLEGLVDCFYHSQMEISPDGKWLLWHGGTDGQETLDAATLDGDYHRQWPGEYWTSRFRWTRDSRHWIEFRRDGSDQSPSQALVHNVYQHTNNRRFSVGKGSLESDLSDSVVGNRLVSIGRYDPGEISRILSVTVSSLPPHIRRERTTQISIPGNLPNSNIAYAILSPDAKRVALIVGYGGADVGGEDTTAGDTSVASTAYRPRSVFKPRDRNAKLRAYCILVCRVDGSEMHEVGTWLEEVNPNTILDLENLRWLPSGKRLSFFCENALYTVPAD
jgi:hypothetical protein